MWCPLVECRQIVHLIVYHQNPICLQTKHAVPTNIVSIPNKSAWPTRHQTIEKPLVVTDFCALTFAKVPAQNTLALKFRRPVFERTPANSHRDNGATVKWRATAKSVCHQLTYALNLPCQLSRFTRRTRKSKSFDREWVFCLLGACFVAGCGWWKANQSKWWVKLSGFVFTSETIANRLCLRFILCSVGYILLPATSAGNSLCIILIALKTHALKTDNMLDIHNDWQWHICTYNLHPVSLCETAKALSTYLPGDVYCLRSWHAAA